MPANTPRGFPYPLPAEPVAEGAQAIRNLAEAIDAKEAGRELSYTEFTAAVAVAVTGAPGVTIVTAPALTFDGTTAVLVEFFSPAFATSGNANQALSADLYDGGTTLGRIAIVSNCATPTSVQTPVRAGRRLTPAAGSHTFIVYARNAVAGTSQVYGGPGGAGPLLVPGYIRVARV